MTLKEIILSKKSTIIDVRNEAELAEGFYPGAVNIPVHEIPTRIEEIKKMQTPLIFYCRSGSRSAMAIMMLKSAGIETDIYNGGGYQDLVKILN